MANISFKVKDERIVKFCGQSRCGSILRRMKYRDFREYLAKEIDNQQVRETHGGETFWNLRLKGDTNIGKGLSFKDC